jgi:PAS domain S-box-containing protein
MIVSIFVSEALVMLLLSYLKPMSMFHEAFVDSLLLSILSAPLLYILLFRPMIMHIAHRTEAEAELVRSNETLQAEINERKRAEEALRNLSHAIKQSPASIVITDTKGNIEYVNPKFTELTGYTHEEAIGQNPRVLRSGEHPPEFYKQLWDTITSGKEWKGEFHNKKKDGNLFWESASISPVTDEAGVIRHFIAVKEDITERRETEERLRRSEEKYRTLFEESKDAVFMGTPDGEVLDCNHALVELLGFSSKKELLQIKDIRQLYYDANERDVFIREIAKNGFIKNFEVVLKRTDGEKVFALHTANVIRDEDGAVASYQSIIRDMTGYKELEQQLMQSQKMEAIGQLTGGIAHDFNNMLMAIMMHTDNIQMLIKEGDPLKAKVKHITNVAEKAAGLTQRLLAFSRKQMIIPKPVEINDIVENAEDLLLRLIGEDIDFKTSLARDALTIMADSGQIEQVFMNFATNARDAMPDGGSLIISTERVTLGDDFIRANGYGEPGSYACITVRDTGTGMNEETKRKLFEPFFTTKEVGKGTGLGLSVVYGIVKQHNGYINVYSEPGTGTEFKIYLPVVESAVVGVEEESPQPTVLIGGTGTVLLAEDNADIRELIKIVLEDCGYDVIDAVDGNDAIEKFMQNKEKIRLLLLDVIMPGKNGKEVYDAAREVSPETRVLFLSGYTEDIINKTGVIERGVKLVSKPVTPRELLSSVREVLAN